MSLQKKITFSLSCLKNLVASEGSHVYCYSNCRRTLKMYPYDLNDIKGSVKELLNDKVTTYDAELDGIILAFKFAKIPDSVELSGDPWFQVDVISDIYVFKPTVGSILTGKINKKSKDVVNCIVHSIFNVAITKPKSERWSDWSLKMKIGSSVKCCVNLVNFTGRLPYIRAEFVSVEEENDDGVDSGVQESLDEDACEGEKRKSRKRERKSSESSNIPCKIKAREETESSCGTESAHTPEHCSKKKKKKKKSVESEQEPSTSKYDPAVDDVLQQIMKEKFKLKQEPAAEETSEDKLNLKRKSSTTKESPPVKIKKKKTKDPDLNAMIQSMVEERCNETQLESSSKKKKKKKKSHESM